MSTSPKPAHTITALPGDGIGPEVMNAAIQAISATGVEIDWELVGAEAAAPGATELGALPANAIESIRRTGVALKGRGPRVTECGPSQGAGSAYDDPPVALSCRGPAR